MPAIKKDESRDWTKLKTLDDERVKVKNRGRRDPTKAASTEATIYTQQ